MQGTSHTHSWARRKHEFKKQWLHASESPHVMQVVKLWELARQATLSSTPQHLVDPF